MGYIENNDHIVDQSNHPYWDLPLADLRCMNASCKAFIISFNASQERYSNSNYLPLALWTTLFWSSMILIFTIPHLWRRIADMNRRRHLKDKIQGAWRFWTYRRLDGWLGEQLDLSYGVLVLLSAATVFLTVLPFYQGFYLREQFRFGSPPLSVRCALLITALTPVMMLLAGKMNLITIMTGISYAKLNVWHRFVGYAIFALSIVHTVPHIIAPVQEGGWAELAYLYKIQRREFSGTFLLFVFILLVVFSLPYFRARFYEIFKHTHILFALFWFGLMFWHIRNEYAAPEFFMAAAGVWGCSVIARMVYRNLFVFPLSNVTRGFPATLEELPGNMTRVVITVPDKMRWMPGQHCYVTVPGISSLGNHPFTIASVPRSRYEGRGQSNEMMFLIRECGGFTKLLGKHAKSVSALYLAGAESGSTEPATSICDEAFPSTTTMAGDEEPNTSRPATSRASSASPPLWPLRDGQEPSRPISAATLAVPRASYGYAKSPSSGYISLCKLESQIHLPSMHAQVTAWIDGPFGDYQRPLHRHYEGFVTIAGGSGVTASLPWLTYLTGKMRRASETRYSGEGEEYECRMRNVTFIWSIRKVEWIAWARREVVDALQAVADLEVGCLRVVVYVTGREEDKERAKDLQRDILRAAGLTKNVDGDENENEKEQRASMKIRFGRPRMEEVVPEFLDRKRNMVRVCGPNALKSGVANAVAGLQRLVMRGEVQSIVLDSETFGEAA